jgi:hypothetical protein
MISRRFLFPLFILVILQILNCSLVIGEPVLVHLAPISDANFIASIHVRDKAPEEIILGTENLGAYCGGGTPASIWKVRADPLTGLAQSPVRIQYLSRIQNIRRTISESSDGTLFTGGGWCLYKPPYYSTDGGDTWQSADSGTVYPPNSTFSFVEFDGEVYAGTGYEPYPGEVYRWLGDGNWEYVFSFPSDSRNIVNSMQEHDGKLFVSSRLYGGSSPYICSTSHGVYVSSDGHSFNPTTGIPSCHTVHEMFIVDEDLFALTENINNRGITHIYLWDEQTWSHLGTTSFLWNDTFRPVVIDDGFIYSYGRPSENAVNGIYRSYDYGQTWQFVVAQQDPVISTLHIHDNHLYAGTYHDTNHNAHLYMLSLSEVCEAGDLNCNGVVDRKDIEIIKTHRNQPASECPQCDIDFDGRVTILDMRKLLLMCTCSLCVCP